ncbi:MAG TPA: tetratricopeptide repeat protein [Candidatus Cloacimonetes bacterium]|nr:tetratricopeptide repeat protein [Candidatus Cloacimonadota bacterium]HEX37415.1 tetratricopeptide repeat protein [Candidatus Cloacimonadota bacterium]
MKKIIIITIFISLVTTLCAKTFIREYNYRAGEADSKLTARAIALEQVKRLLLEEIGVYISTSFENETIEVGEEVKELTSQEIEVISAGITETKILEEDWTGDNYYIKAEIDVDEDDVLDRLNDVVQDQERAKELEESRKRADEALVQIEELNKKLSALEQENEALKQEQDELETHKEILAEDKVKEKEYEIQLGQSKIDQKKRELHEQYVAENNKLAAEYWFQQGISAKEKGNFDKAIEDLQKAMDYNTDDPRIYAGLGMLHGMRKEFDQSINYYTKALELRPKDARTMVGLAIVYDEQGDPIKAKEMILEALQLQPNYVNGLLSLANIHNKLGNYEQAREILVKLIKAKPRLAVAYLQLSGVMKYLNEPEKAYINLQKAAELGNKKAKFLLKEVNKQKKK